MLSQKKEFTFLKSEIKVDKKSSFHWAHRSTKGNRVVFPIPNEKNDTLYH